MAICGAVVLGVADWLLVQDLGFFGGVGTDPNSMVPLLLLLVSAYLAMAHPTTVVTGAPAAAPATAVRPPSWVTMPPLALTRAVAAVAALAVVLVGAVPMAAAAMNGQTDPILATALDGTPNQVDTPAPGFSLTDQAGRPVTLAGLRGHVVALTFLDPVCTSDCPLIAQEFRQADAMLGGNSSHVALVAVVDNPIYRAVPFLVAFDRQEGLDHLHNWFFLTGSPAALAQVWRRYGVVAQVSPAGAMVDHSDIAYLIDARGRTREILSAVPGAGAASASSYSSYLTQGLEHVLHA
jgi:cytochrome oxidase Cu insertion factor (SCO1/SenC/PrrC family)